MKTSNARNGIGSSILPASAKLQKRFFAKIQKTETCWLWIGAQSQGYGQIWVNGRFAQAHLVAWLIAYGEHHGQEVLRHSCDNPLCVRVEHLVPGSHAQNVEDRVRRNRSAKGERNGRAKLSQTDVVAIRELLAQKQVTKKSIAQKFGVSPRTVRDIELSATWNSL